MKAGGDIATRFLTDTEVKDMSYAIVRGAGYVLVYTTDMILHNGTTQTTERHTNPDSDYLKKVLENTRTFEQVINYAPDQVYIGNLMPEALRHYEKALVR